VQANEDGSRTHFGQDRTPLTLVRNKFEPLSILASLKPSGLGMVSTFLSTFLSPSLAGVFGNFLGILKAGSKKSSQSPEDMVDFPMRTLLFIHGVGVRGDAWFSGFDLISRKANRFLPGVEVRGCQWGDAFGARLHRGGATIPGYCQTGDSEPAADDASRSRWYLLSTNPLLELRLLPEEGYLGEVPGQEIFRLIPRLAINEAVIGVLREWSPADLWTGFIRDISFDPEWKFVVESITASAAAASEKVARAITAAYQRKLREGAFPNPTGVQRDQLKDAMISALGGPPLGIGDWLLGRITNFSVRRRGSLSDATTPAVGDIIRYQSRGAEIRKFIAHRVKETGASILVTHSLGGVAAVDWLASSEYALATAGDAPKVHYLITVGSQSPFFYELDGLVSRPFGAGLPEWFPEKWINYYDRADLLSYMAEPAFPGRARDVEVDNGQPFPESHSAYWNNDDQVWKTMAAFLAES
jgi:hypothetical protein